MGDSAEREVVGYNTYNPCYCLRLATRAVLKCLGLDSPSDQGEGKRSLRLATRDVLKCLGLDSSSDQGEGKRSLRLATRVVLKCLGLDSSLDQGEGKRNETSYQYDPPSIAGQRMESNEDGRTRFLAFGRAPSRPPVGPGKPPVHN